MASNKSNRKENPNQQALNLLFAASMISNIAQGFTLLSIPWYFARSGMANTFNLVYAFITAIALFWALYAGALVDRYDRKKLFLALNAIQGTFLFGAALTGYSLGYMPYWLTSAVFGITILGFSVHFPNIYALLQSLITAQQYTKVSSTLEIIHQVSTVVSGALIVVLLDGTNTDINLLGLDFTIALPQWSMADIFMLDAGTYLLAFILISAMHYEEKLERVIERGSVVRRLKTGITYLKDHIYIMTFGLCTYAVFAVTVVHLHGLMPAYISEHLQSSAKTVGLTEIVYGAGAVTAGLLIERIFRYYSKLNAILILMSVNALLLVAAMLNETIWIFVAVNFFIGITNPGIRILRVAWLFNHVPNGVIGRVNSVFSSANTLARIILLGIFGIPFFTEGSNVTYAYLVMGAFVFFAFLILSGYKKGIEKITTY